MTLKQIKKRLNALPNTITIKPSMIEATHIANPNQYGSNAQEIWLKKPNDNINPFTMIMVDGWAYEVLDIISTTAIVIKML